MLSERESKGDITNDIFSSYIILNGGFVTMRSLWYIATTHSSFALFHDMHDIDDMHDTDARTAAAAAAPPGMIHNRTGKAALSLSNSLSLLCAIMFK